MSGKSHNVENLKQGTLWIFQTFILLQNFKKMKERLFGDFKKFRKRGLQTGKRGKGCPSAFK